MKKLWIVAAVISLVGFGTLAAGNQPTAAQVGQAPVSTDLTELINNIPVPYQVLLDAQMEHPGFAVMNAEKISRNGSERYRLHIQGSDQSISRTNLYLMYDMEWRLTGEETFVASPPVFHEPEPTEPQPEQPQGEDPGHEGENEGDEEEDEEEQVDDDEFDAEELEPVEEMRPPPRRPRD